MKTIPNTVKQETPPPAPPAPNRRPPKTSPAGPDSPEFAEVLDQIRRELMPLLKPLLEFHQPVETATMDDLKIYWDVRLVRGRNTPYTQLTGSGSLQRALAPGMLGDLTERIQRDLTENILKPLTSILQEKTIEQSEELHARERAKREDAADHRCDGDGD